MVSEIARLNPSDPMGSQKVVDGLFEKRRRAEVEATFIADELVDGYVQRVLVG